MKIQTHTVNGKKIYVIDDAYSRTCREKFYQYVANAYYKVQGGGAVAIEDCPDLALQAMYNEKDLNDLGIFNDAPPEVKELLKPLRIYRAYSLLLNYSQNPHFHSDSWNAGDMTLLYYANLRWDIDWGGETVFADDSLEDIVYTSIYKPGRLVLYDSSIVHKPCTPVSGAPGFRFTFVANFNPSTTNI